MMRTLLADGPFIGSPIVRADGSVLLLADEVCAPEPPDKRRVGWKSIFGKLSEFLGGDKEVLADHVRQ